MVMRDDEDQPPVASASRTTTTVALALAALVGAAAVVTVVGLRLANRVREPLGQNWWLVGWLVVGASYGVAGAALVTRAPHRRLGGFLVVVGSAAVVVAVAVQSAGFVDAMGPQSPWDRLRSAQDWARPVATGVLIGLVPWELVPIGRRPWVNGIQLATGAAVLLAATANAAGAARPGLDLVEVAFAAVAASGVAATGRLLVVWWRQRERG